MGKAFRATDRAPIAAVDRPDWTDGMSTDELIDALVARADRFHHAQPRMSILETCRLIREALGSKGKTIQRIQL